MFSLKSTIQQIESLLSEDTQASLTYAALECRLALEIICYERLRICHDYISHKDLRKWQPRDIVNKLINEVDAYAKETQTLSVSQSITDQNNIVNVDIEGEQTPKLIIGTQVGFDPQKIGRLWNALSGIALHVRIPIKKADRFAKYSDKEAIRIKVIEALDEIRRIGEGTLISSGFGENINFTCYCGSKISRRLSLLKDRQKISCINPDCDETYEYFIDGQKFLRRTIDVKCKSCGEVKNIPSNMVEAMKSDQHLSFNCVSCGDQIIIAYRLMQAQKKSESG